MGELFIDLRLRDGKRLSVFGLTPSPTWTSQTDRARPRNWYQLTLRGKASYRREIAFQGKTNALRLTRGCSVVGRNAHAKGVDLSGIGDEAELQRLGIPVVQHLQGWGRTFMGHFGYWLYLGIPGTAPIHNNGASNVLLEEQSCS